MDPNLIKNIFYYSKTFYLLNLINIFNGFQHFDHLIDIVNQDQMNLIEKLTKIIQKSVYFHAGFPNGRFDLGWLITQTYLNNRRKFVNSSTPCCNMVTSHYLFFALTPFPVLRRGPMLFFLKRWHLLRCIFSLFIDSCTHSKATLTIELSSIPYVVPYLPKYANIVSNVALIVFFNIKQTSLS